MSSDIPLDDDITSREQFETALNRLLRTALQNGVDPRGAWEYRAAGADRTDGNPRSDGNPGSRRTDGDHRTDGATGDWEVMVVELEDSESGG